MWIVFTAIAALIFGFIGGLITGAYLLSNDSMADLDNPGLLTLDKDHEV